MSSSSTNFFERLGPQGQPVPPNTYRDREEASSDYESDPDVAMSGTEDQPQSETARAFQRVVDKLPEHFRFVEFKKDEANPYLKDIDGIDLSAVHAEYRGCDRPNFGASSHVHRMNPAEIHFVDKKFPRLAGNKYSKAGAINKDGKQVAKGVRISFSTDSQMPSVNLHLQHPGSGAWVIYRVFANSVVPAERSKRADGSIETLRAGINMTVYANDMTEANVQAFKKLAHGYSNLTELAQAKELLRLHLRLIAPGACDKKAFKCRPLWLGLTQLELTQVRNKAVDENESKTMNDFERNIWQLDQAEELVVYRKIWYKNHDELAQIIKFKTYFIGVMYLCTSFGNWWFYQLQHDTPSSDWKGTSTIFGSKAILNDLCPPRWLVTKWMATSATQGGRAHKVQELNWAAFSKFAIYPSVDECAFVVRLGLSRERQNQKVIIDRMQQRAKGVCQARFKQMDTVWGGYFVHITLPALDGGMIAESVRPDPDVGIDLHIYYGHGKQLKYTGVVVESIGAGNATENAALDYDFAAQVTGDAHEFPTEAINVTVTFRNDAMTTNRARNCTENLARLRVKRDHGVDLQALCFRAPFTINEAKQGSLSQEVTQADIEDMNNRLAARGLDEKQRQGVILTFKTSTGVGPIYGPPGTGKTTTVAHAANEHARRGRKVMFTCPSNKTVDAALTSFDKVAEEAIKKRTVRFVGGYTAFEDSSARKTTSQAASSAKFATIEAAKEVNGDYLYHVRKATAIDTWAADVAHPMNGTAKEFASAMPKLGNKQGEALNRERKHVRALEAKLAAFFLEHEVDIVFAICGSAGNEEIVEGFKAVVMFIDEASQATIPDVCMTVEPYAEHIKTLVPSGDHKQLKPVIVAKDENEAINALQISLFEQILRDPNERYDHVMLTTQYRSHETLMDWSNHHFYNGKLETSARANQGSRVQRLLKRVLNRGLGGARKNKHSLRLVIDVSGPNAKSVPYIGTTSYCNEAEADYIVRIISMLLHTEPKSSEQAVTPEMIGIITPYKGQQRFIRNKLNAYGPGSPESRVRVEGFLTTTWGIQGSQVDISFVSLCANNPQGAMSKMKFIAEPSALNVQSTRARKFQIWTGNFLGWMYTRVYAPMKSFVEHMHQRDDIVSWQDINTWLPSDSTDPAQPTTSRFYTTDMPNLNQQEGGKRKSRAKDHRKPAKSSKKHTGASAKFAAHDDKSG
ncbi:hypothetical protein N0V90_002096 [Kalmusia sp. IMI 367209]|nr:hypothetical protein N0V90_002096 [Kalmusia sp. IMI 367209]